MVSAALVANYHISERFPMVWSRISGGHSRRLLGREPIRPKRLSFSFGGGANDFVQPQSGLAEVLRIEPLARSLFSILRHQRDLV